MKGGSFFSHDNEERDGRGLGQLASTIVTCLIFILPSLDCQLSLLPHHCKLAAVAPAIAFEFGAG